MASSRKKKKGIKKVVKKVIPWMESESVEKREPKKRKSSVIKKKNIERIIEIKRVELKKKKDFVKRLEITIKTEQSKISELEGAILALYELVTGEKIE